MVLTSNAKAFREWERRDCRSLCCSFFSISMLVLLIAYCVLSDDGDWMIAQKPGATSVVTHRLPLSRQSSPTVIRPKRVELGRSPTPLYYHRMAWQPLWHCPLHRWEKLRAPRVTPWYILTSRPITAVAPIHSRAVIDRRPSPIVAPGWISIPTRLAVGHLGDHAGEHGNTLTHGARGPRDGGRGLEAGIAKHHLVDTRRGGGSLRMAASAISTLSQPRKCGDE